MFLIDRNEALMPEKSKTVLLKKTVAGYDLMPETVF